MEEEEEEEGAGGISLFGDTTLSLEADLEYVYESQGGTRADEVSFDEVSLLFDGGWGEAALGISYESGKGGGTTVEEAWIRGGGVASAPWFLQAGRSELPFGEHDSEFNEDPLVTVLGEIEEDAIVAGYATERIEAALGAFRTDLARDDSAGLVAAVSVSPRDGVDLGISWTSHLGESLELRDLYRERQREIRAEEMEEDAPEGEEDEENAVESPTEPPEGPSPPPERLHGCAVFVAADAGPLRFYAEYLTAMESFDAGVLDNRRRKPSAWVAEAGWRPIDRCEVALRYEEADELPDNPDRQFGAALTLGLTDWATLTVEALHGDFPDDEPDRTLYGARVGFLY
jgi:hypothetical protein